MSSTRERRGPRSTRTQEQFAGVHAAAPLLGAWERVATLPIHVALSVMVLLAFVRGKRWWWFALAAHTLVNFAGLAILQLAKDAWGPTTAAQLVEGVITVFALLAVGFVFAARRSLAP